MTYYNSNDYCNAVQMSGANSDYMHMTPIYNCLGQGNSNYNAGLGGSIYNYGSYNTGFSTADKWALGIGAIGTIFAGIGMSKMAKMQAQQQQAMQAMQYDQYMQQSTALYQQQQQQQSQQSMTELLQVMLLMKKLNTTTTT